VDETVTRVADPSAACLERGLSVMKWVEGTVNLVSSG